jgi:hypothetical protein
MLMPGLICFASLSGETTADSQLRDAMFSIGFLAGKNSLHDVSLSLYQPALDFSKSRYDLHCFCPAHIH